MAMLDQSTSEADILEIQNVHDDFTDQLGIMTHHDAVTGTADKVTVEDYSARLHNIITKDRKVYSKYIGKQIKDLTGITFSDEWLSCFRENSTYYDCPITEEHSYFSVAVHNPADIEQKFIKIAVPGQRRYTVKDNAG